MNLRGYRPSKVGNARMVRKAAEVINAAERPIIMAGHGIDISGAAEELLLLATRGSIPVVSTLHGVGTFPETHPLSFGMLGMHGLAYANFAMRQTDCIIGLGTRFDDRAVGKEGTSSDRAPRSCTLTLIRPRSARSWRPTCRSSAT